MAIFNITTSSFLGYMCCGSGVYADGKGNVTLSEEQVQDIVDLIKEKDGETDINILNLKERLPEVYSVLDKAYHDTAYNAEYNHWLLEGDMDDAFFRPDDFEERLKEDGLFTFEFDEEAFRDENDLTEDDEISEEDIEQAEEDAFEEWLQDYKDSLSDDEKIEFLKKYFDDIVDLDYDEVEYKVEIPKEIVSLAK